MLERLDGRPEDDGEKGCIQREDHDDDDNVLTTNRRSFYWWSSGRSSNRSIVSVSTLQELVSSSAGNSRRNTEMEIA